jgi:DNA-binding response OmpR family regulator
MPADEKPAPHILCVSWDATLAVTRELLLSKSGYKVTSAIGAEESIKLCSTKTDLLVLGHSVPREQKQIIVKHFRKFNSSPALSLVANGQSRLSEVDYAVECFDPKELLRIVESIIPLHFS